MKKTFCAVGALCALVCACSSRDSLDKRGPDEYMVLSNPPLVLPPDFTLRAPVKSAAPAVNPAQEQVKKDLSLSAKESDGNLSDGEKALLQKSGTGDKNIKESLKKNESDYEKNTLVLDKKLKNAPTEESVDAKKEAEKLQKQGVKTTGATQP